MSFLMVFAAAALAGLLLLVVNTGTHTIKKIELQNTTDAAVYTEATWISRGLNVISMNNVIQANLLAVAFAVPSFDRALGVSLLILRAEIIACHAAAAVSFGAAEFLCVAMEYAHQAITTFKNTVLAQAVRLTEPTDGLIWTIMGNLGTESEVIMSVVPGLAVLETNRIAIADGKARGALVVGRSESGGPTLLPIIPAEVGTFQDLCNASRRPLYPSNESPIDAVTDAMVDNFAVSALNFVTGFKTFYRAFLEAQYAQYCQGPATSTSGPLPVDTMAECRARGGEARWGASVYRGPLRATYFDAVRDLDVIANESVPISYRQFTQRCTWRPPGEIVRGSEQYFKSAYVQEVGSAEAPSYRAVVTLYRAELMTVPNETYAPPIPAAAAGNDWRPKPVVLVDDGNDRSTRGARARLEYLAVTMSYPTRRFGGKSWASSLGENTFAYGQARTFNPTTFDLFTQNWRAKLAPATALENGMLNGPLDDANPLPAASSMFLPRDLQESVALLNNH